MAVVSRPAKTSLSVIPAFSADLRLTKTLRYKYTATVSNNYITRADLINSMFVNGASGTTNYSLFSSVRIVRVDLYDLGGSTEMTVSEMRWQWYSKNAPATDFSVSGTPLKPGFMSLTPPKNSLAGFWSGVSVDGTERLATFNLPLDCVVDLTIECVLTNSRFAANVVSTAASGVAGSIYQAVLDTASTQKYLIPVGHISIV